jgi:hypothetical protein
MRNRRTDRRTAFVDIDRLDRLDSFSRLDGFGYDRIECARNRIQQNRRKKRTQWIENACAHRVRIGDRWTLQDVGNLLPDNLNNVGFRHHVADGGFEPETLDCEHCGFFRHIARIESALFDAERLEIRMGTYERTNRIANGTGESDIKHLISFGL